MQTQQIQQERRASGVRRVKFETLVEVVGQELDTPAFEGRAIDVSGRGMQIVSTFVPERKTALVLRFEHQGREVVIEGVVAWRKDGKPNGSFGLRFTALDSKSVVVLKEICATEVASERVALLPQTSSNQALFEELDESETPEPVITTTTGAPLKLHLEGLAAPMKARVVDARHSRLRVGSQLEFLTLGRKLMVEDLTGGLQKPAHVHSVNVEVNPDTQVPQLVVTVRWEGATDVTPEPTVVSSKRRGAIDPDDLFGEDEATSPGRQVRAVAKPKLAAQKPAPEVDEEYDDFDDEDDDLNTAEALLKGRVALWAVGASKRMKEASEQVAQASRSVAGMVSGLLSKPAPKPSPERRAAASRGTRSLRPVASQPAAKGRVHAARGSSSPTGRTSGAPRRSAAAGSTVDPKKRLAVVGLAAVTLALGVFMLRGQPDKPNAANAGAQASGGMLNGAVPNSVAANGMPQGGVVMGQPQAVLPQPGIAGSGGAVVAPGVGAQPNAVMPGQALARQPLNTNEQLRADTFGMVANVPLFGPTQMATTEPAPDGDERVVAVAPRRAAVDEISLAKDESFSDKPAPAAQVAAAQANKAFQVGRLSEPVVHRLRLDAPGESLTGEKTTNGFSILVPGRKVMENGASIVNADARVSQVNVKNSPAGAKVTFRFGKDVSGYKVRLRNDYLEFFLNP